MPSRPTFKRHGPLSILFLTLLSGGCSTIGDVTPALRIDIGEHPAYQDEQVRFRTTYYFRIVDSCNVEEGRGKGATIYEENRGPFRVRKTGKLKIVNDSLYRFRMTGKASALFAKIRFESGVLRAEEIEPFGSTVAPDKKTGEFHVTPARVNHRNARREEIKNRIGQLKDLLEEAKKDKLGNRKVNDQSAQSILENMIVNEIKLLAAENDTGDPNSEAQPDCPDGRPSQRSYSLYGPEGVRHLDPDERLLMAMTSDSKPLIGMLQELADRSLKAQQIPGTEFKDIAAERSRVSNAQHDIEMLRKKDKLTESDIAELIKKLEMHFKSQL